MADYDRTRSGRLRAKPAYQRGGGSTRAASGMRLRLRPALLGLAASVLAVLGFIGYLRPAFMVSIANQIWLCF